MKHWISTSLLCLLVANMTHAEPEKGSDKGLNTTKIRQQTYSSIEKESEKLEDLVDDQKWQEAAPLAEELALKVAKLQTLFPASSKGEGRARDSVWEEWSEFSARLQNLEADFLGVSVAIAAGDHQKAEDSLDDATSACNSCHMSYRSLW
jgi:cytochrome c556|tara:strand:+ start:212 stop:661 length:450 start_codon:yes stop_codon:yes gene_type:complete